MVSRFQTTFWLGGKLQIPWKGKWWFRLADLPSESRMWPQEHKEKEGCYLPIRRLGVQPMSQLQFQLPTVVQEMQEAHGLGRQSRAALAPCQGSTRSRARTELAFSKRKRANKRTPQWHHSLSEQARGYAKTTPGPVEPHLKENEV
jgi:hypothetical protein